MNIQPRQLNTQNGCTPPSFLLLQDDRTKSVSGFTLIETLVGLTVFMIAFVAVSQVSSNSLQDINQTKRRLTAQYLAQEGVEYVKQIQKSFILQGFHKDEFMNQFVNPNCSNGCDFYLGNNTTQGFGGGTGIDGANIFVNPPGGGALPNEIGIASSTAGSPEDLPKLKYYEFGLIALEGLYSNDLVDSEYSRVVTIRDVSTNPALSQAIEVTSAVYFSSANYSGNVNENSVVLTEIMHFDF